MEHSMACRGMACRRAASCQARAARPPAMPSCMQAAATPLPIPPELVGTGNGKGEPCYEHAGGGWFVRLMPHDFITTVSSPRVPQAWLAWERMSACALLQTMCVTIGPARPAPDRHCCTSCAARPPLALQRCPRPWFPASL